MKRSPARKLRSCRFEALAELWQKQSQTTIEMNLTQTVSASASGRAKASAPWPRHIAIVMDGNGRWAKERGLPRAFGHERGVEAVRRTVEAAVTMGLGHLTLFGFSTENWSRPPSEIEALFGLLRAYVQRDLERLARDNVRVRIIGRRAGLDEDLQAIIDNAQARTALNTGLNLTIAFNYGSRAELADAVKSIAEDVRQGTLQPEAVTESLIARRLLTADLPDPDLVIRTSGEARVSNFLLWQSAYSEFVFLDVKWPDFDAKQLDRAIEEYGRRQRRFGGVTEAHES